MNHYQAFRDLKQSVKEDRNKQNAERTLRYFDMITEMLGRVEYASNVNYLQSVYDYISNNEYISDKQCEIVDRISEHPDIDYGEEPF